VIGDSAVQSMVILLDILKNFASSCSFITTDLSERFKERSWCHVTAGTTRNVIVTSSLDRNANQKSLLVLVGGDVNLSHRSDLLSVRDQSDAKKLLPESEDIKNTTRTQHFARTKPSADETTSNMTTPSSTSLSPSSAAAAAGTLQGIMTQCSDDSTVATPGERCVYKHLPNDVDQHAQNNNYHHEHHSLLSTDKVYSL